IHLPNFVSDWEELLGIGCRLEPARGPAANGFVITIRDRHVHARVIVGGGAEDDVVFADAKAPGVVVAGANEFERRAVRLETIDALTEAHPFATDNPFKTGIADRSP